MHSFRKAMIAAAIAGGSLMLLPVMATGASAHVIPAASVHVRCDVITADYSDFPNVPVDVTATVQVADNPSFSLIQATTGSGGQLKFFIDKYTHNLGLVHVEGDITWFADNHHEDTHFAADVTCGCPTTTTTSTIPVTTTTEQTTTTTVPVTTTTVQSTTTTALAVTTTTLPSTTTTVGTPVSTLPSETTSTTIGGPPFTVIQTTTTVTPTTPATATTRLAMTGSSTDTGSKVILGFLAVGVPLALIFGNRRHSRG